MMNQAVSFFDLHDSRVNIADPYDHEYHVKVPKVFCGITIDEYYSKRFPYKTRDLWMKSIEEGRVRINGLPITPDTVIQPEAIIDSLVYDIREPPINVSWNVLFEDEYLYIIDKPGHLPVHPTGRFYKHSFLQIMMDRDPGWKIHVMHRLDVETSGILIVGKTKEAASAFFKIFKNKEIQKEYKALVRGAFPKEGIIVDGPLGKSINSTISVKMEVNGVDNKEAISKYELLELRENGTSLIKCIPITGRTNQLRAHIEHAGFPILGDKIYCKDDSIFHDYHEDGETESLKKKLILNRQALHAYKVSFIHPFTKEQMTIESDFPDDINYFGEV
ncbi:MAG: hypothetical protein COA79_19460 [Planctomycetota bacterium]|nr:MAG: hypothetical protein COA79_19460 [Planctomycetota bacterium]